MKKETVIAKNIHNLKKLINDCMNKEGPECDLNHIDTSNVTDMSELFYDSNFNGDISKWNVSNVTNMYNMFCKSQFNRDISKWNVSNVVDMSYMFYDSKFNGNISEWDVSNVQHMNGMFGDCLFTGDILKWNVKNVRNMLCIFHNCKIANPPYWAKIKDFEDRKEAIEGYLFKQQLNNLILNPNSINTINKL